MPKVSILMSVFNGERYLNAAVQSVLASDFEDYEFVIVNDGSTDSTATTLDALGEQNGRVRVIHKKNAGLASALNTGLAHASGKYVARLDVDDLSLPGRLRIQTRHMEDRPSVGLIGSNAIFIDAQGNQVGRSSLGRIDPAGCLGRMERMDAFFPHSSWMVRAELMHALGGYDEFFKKAQDFDFSLRLSEIADIECLPDFLVALRRHSGSISHDDEFMQVRYAVTALVLHWGRTGRLRVDATRKEVVMQAVDRWFEHLNLRQRLRGQRAISFAYVALRGNRLREGLAQLAQAVRVDPGFVLSRFWLANLRRHLLPSLAPFVEQ